MTKPQDDAFRERMKDILVQKDDLETHLFSALETAKNKDDLMKLSATVKKMEKVLGELKTEIDKRGASFAIGSEKIDTPKQPASVPPVASQTKPVANPNPPARAPLLPTPQGYTGMPTQSQASGPKAPNNQTRKFDYSQFRKNPSIPDSQRIYLHSLSPTTTEEMLFNFFSELGYRVVDVKVFYSKVTSGAVGFSNTTAVKEVLPQTFTINGHRVTVRQYYSDTGKNAHYSGNNNRESALQSRFQVFCGGIPVRATLPQVKTVLGQYGKIRDLRMPSMKDGNGALTHRGYAFVDFENAEDAQYLCDTHMIAILGKDVECMPNTRPLDAILADPALKSTSPSLRGSMADLTAALPKVPVSAGSQGQNGPGKKSGAGDAPVLAAKEEKCRICKKNVQNCVILWCGHRETCMECGAQLKNCPKSGCGSKVDSIVLDEKNCKNEPSTV